MLSCLYLLINLIILITGHVEEPWQPDNKCFTQRNVTNDFNKTTGFQGTPSEIEELSPTENTADEGNTIDNEPLLAENNEKEKLNNQKHTVDLENSVTCKNRTHSQQRKDTIIVNRCYVQIERITSKVDGNVKYTVSEQRQDGYDRSACREDVAKTDAVKHDDADKVVLISSGDENDKGPDLSTSQETKSQPDVNIQNKGSPFNLYYQNNYKKSALPSFYP